ncbi:hypothetical protein [Kitasatospora sp. NPDC057223]|uniref:hypothetical protein n=1 Tax=Kitasatospora sp. NPDC057223 TaxID=3346055 RepID=UPI003633EACF
MTLFYCSKCGAVLTPELTALAAVPDPLALPLGSRGRGGEPRRAPSTVPAGHYAVDPEPWGAPFVPRRAGERPGPARPRGLPVPGDVVSTGTRNTVVVHPDDVPGLRPPPGGRGDHGCCGPTGADGLNLACSCGVRLATLAADCLGPYELHLDPVRVYAFDA